MMRVFVSLLQYADCKTLYNISSFSCADTFLERSPIISLRDIDVLYESTDRPISQQFPSRGGSPHRGVHRHANLKGLENPGVLL